MRQVVIGLDQRTMERLKQVVPARRRSEFIRGAIRRALNERLEADMERAYATQPPGLADVDLDPSTWGPRPREKKG